MPAHDPPPCEALGEDSMGETHRPNFTPSAWIWLIICFGSGKNVGSKVRLPLQALPLTRSRLPGGCRSHGLSMKIVEIGMPRLLNSPTSDSTWAWPALTSRHLVRPNSLGGGSAGSPVRW